MEGKHHQRKLHSVKTILGTSIGAGCSNQIQLAQGHHLNAKCYLHLVAASRSYTCTQDGLDTVQLAVIGGESVALLGRVGQEE